MNAVVTLESILTPAAAPLSAEALFGSGQVETIVSAIEAQVRAEVIDIASPDGRKAAKSLAYKVARSKTILDEIGKEHVAEIKAQSAKIDAERKTLRDRLDALKAEVSRPVDQWEEAEADRVSGHENALVMIIQAPAFAHNANAAVIRERIEAVASLFARDWQEFKERADVAVTEALATLSGALAEAEQREKDAAELEALRAEMEALRAEKAARDASAEQARKDQEAAERGEQMRQAEEAREKARAEQAKRDQEAAVARAIEQERQRAEQARIEAEQKAEREKIAAIEAERRRQEQDARDAAAKKAAEEAAEQKRQANKRLRNKVHAEMEAAFLSCGFEPGTVPRIVEAIRDGLIPHVSITY